MPLFLPLVLAFLQAPQPSATGTDTGGAMTAYQQSRVRQAVREGRIVPLEQVLVDALRRYPGTLVEVELEGDEYEIEILGADGVVMELDYDARTGRLKKMEIDD